MVFLFLLGISLEVANSDNSFLSMLFVFISLLLTSIYILNYINLPKNFYRQNPLLQEECVLTVSDEGIFGRTRLRETNLKWEACKKASETKKFYFIWYGENSFSVIPKRAFTSKQDEEVFQSLLKTHIGSATQFKEIENEYVPKYVEPPDWR